MIRLKTLLYIIIVIFLFNSCMTTSLLEKYDYDMNLDQGVLFANVIIDQIGWTISLYPRNSEKDKGLFGRPVAVIENLSCGNNLIALKLKEGKYTIQYAYYDPFAFELEPLEFIIEKGCICYIGNLEMSVTEKSKYFPNFNYRYLNDYNNCKIEFSSKFPIMSGKYPFKNCFVYQQDLIWKKPIQKI